MAAANSADRDKRHLTLLSVSATLITEQHKQRKTTMEKQTYITNHNDELSTLKRVEIVIRWAILKGASLEFEDILDFCDRGEHNAVIRPDLVGQYALDALNETTPIGVYYSMTDDYNVIKTEALD